MTKEEVVDYREFVHTPDVWQELWDCNAVLSPDILREAIPAYAQFEQLAEVQNIWSKTRTIVPVEQPAVISLLGPTSGGKDTANDYIASPHLNIMTTTTRLVRPDQPADDRYVFVSLSEFLKMIRGDEFFEHMIESSGRYGTTKHEVEEKLQMAKAGGIPFVLWRANVQGLQTFAPRMYEEYQKIVPGIFLLPHMPIQAYYEHVVRERGKDEARRRWPTALAEMEHAPEIVDYILENRFDQKDGKQKVINDFNHLILRLCSSLPR